MKLSQRKPRILWANPYCLLDLSSGASITIREQLLQLHERGWDVRILGATIFDGAKGTTRLTHHWETISNAKSKVIRIKDGPLTHNLVKTRSIQRADMTATEEAVWYQTYTKALTEFKPDIVYYYGGRTLDLLIGYEAHIHGIPVAAYLANGNFRGRRWCRDVDLVITNSKAAAAHYKNQDGITAEPVGVFIDPTRFVANDHTHKRVLFVNPSLAKGAAIVIRVAMILEAERPDIQFEVVESRGEWAKLVQIVTAHYGEPRARLSNVTVTANTADMRPIYQRARLLMAPSLWWEAYGRVVAEAHLNRIPTVVTNRGGLPEAVGQGGVVFSLPEEFHDAPYKKIPSDTQLKPIVDEIRSLFNDEEKYAALQAAAENESGKHTRQVRADHLEQLLNDAIEAFSAAPKVVPT